MDLARFLNALRILRSIDRWELDEAKAVTPNLSDKFWVSFRDNPYDFMMRCDDETAAKLWALIEARQPAPFFSVPLDEVAAVDASPGYQRAGYVAPEDYQSPEEENSLAILGDPA